MDSARAAIEQLIENESAALTELSKQIWSRPELALNEVFAHDTLTDFLEKRGFVVERHFVMKTAFRATYKQGDGGAHVVAICEYDALPDIGHACGHNLISESGAATGMALKAALEKNPSINGTVTIMGTPAEEAHGGKIDLIDGGAFKDASVALMAHPNAINMFAPGILSMNSCDVVFTGKAAHAAAAPWEGINALDAAVNAYTAMSMFRQQMRTDCRLHAVISEGGTRANIIPERTTMQITMRAPTDTVLSVIKARVTAILESAAKATGCEVSIKWSSKGDRIAFYRNMLANTDLLQCFEAHWRSFKPANDKLEPNVPWASTDMGNVSYACPSIHPAYYIGESACVHTRNFAAAAMEPEAHAEARCVSKAMACVGWEVLTNNDFLQRVQDTYKKQLANGM